MSYDTVYFMGYIKLINLCTWDSMEFRRSDIQFCANRASIYFSKSRNLFWDVKGASDKHMPIAMCIKKESILLMQPKLIFQCKEMLKFTNVRCFEIHKKLRRAISLLAGHIKGAFLGWRDRMASTLFIF